VLEYVDMRFLAYEGGRCIFVRLEADVVTIGVREGILGWDMEASNSGGVDAGEDITVAITKLGSTRFQSQIAVRSSQSRSPPTCTR
jgi:hypothetical protein